jgi:hypothetical protein
MLIRRGGAEDRAGGRVEVPSPTSSLFSADLQSGYRSFRAMGSEVVVCLQGVPKLRSSSKNLSEEPRRFGGNSPLASDDLVDSLDGYPKVLCKSHLSQTEGCQELLQENFARMGRDALFRQHVELRCQPL